MKRRSRPWTNEEDATIIEKYGVAPVVIGNIIGRKASAVDQRRAYLHKIGKLPSI